MVFTFADEQGLAFGLAIGFVLLAVSLVICRWRCQRAQVRANPGDFQQQLPTRGIIVVQTTVSERTVPMAVVVDNDV